MHLQLVTPERLVVDVGIDEIYAPGVLGEFGILPGHATFLTALGVGEIRYRAAGRDHRVAVSGGFAEVLDDRVTILADAAEPSDEIDVERARRAQQSSAQGLTKAEAGSPDHADLDAAVRRAENRLAVARSRS